MNNNLGFTIQETLKAKMNSIFTASSEQLGTLAPKEAVAFFRELLWAEARRIGIPISKINISLWVNVPDGGIDASVSDSKIDLAIGTGIIKVGDSSYQIKSGSNFQPWQPAQIKRELFGGKLPVKGNLGDSVRACLDNNGTYILVCFGAEFTYIQLQQTKAHIVSCFNQCGYQKPRVEVWGQSTLIGFTSIYPSLVLQLQGFDQSHFQTYASWSRQDDMRNEFKAGQEQIDLIKSLQEDLRRNDQAIHLRVWGEPGVGKTRLVMEALSAEDLRSLVVYCDTPFKLRDSNLLNEIVKEDNSFSVLLVVDECNSDSRSYIWNKLKNLGQRIKLVSIYTEYDDSSGNILYYNAPSLDREQTSSIIQEYGVPKDQAGRGSELCSGSPRVAHVIGWNLKNNPEDILKPLDIVNIWDRYIVGGDDPKDVEVTQRKLVLQYIALFKMFGFSPVVIGESQTIAKLIEQADPNITWARFHLIVKKLQKRRILQGETTLYITPKAFHIQLWREWWNTYGGSISLEDFTRNLPDSLRKWFYDMFIYAAESKAALKIVDELLSENGPFQKDEYLKTKLGADFFLALTEADPKSALICLQNTVGRWSKEERFQLIEPRRNIVWALEKIAVWRDLFQDAARLLLSLGEAENEHYSNNASGVFADLFSPGSGDVAPTEASLEERFPILQEALNSKSKEKRILALNACDKALETRHFSRMVGPEYQGLHKANLWRPENLSELIDSYRRIWQLVYSQLENLQSDEQKKVIEILLSHTRGLTHISGLVDLIIDDLTSLCERSYADLDKIIETIEAVLYYEKTGLSPNIVQKWEKLRSALISGDFHSLMKRYIGMDLLEDKFDDEGNRLDKTGKIINELVEQIIADHKLLESELSWLVTIEAKNGYRFGYELGRQDREFSILPLLLESLKQAEIINNASDYFLGGYLKALFEKDPEHWENLLDELAKDETLGIWVSDLTWRSGMSNRAALRILDLARKGVIKYYNFRVFGLGSVISDLSDNVFNQWIEFLLDSPDDFAASIALDLYHFFYIRKDAKYKLPFDLTQRLLMHPSLFRHPKEGKRNPMDDFHWTEIGKMFVKIYPKASINLIDTIFEHFGEDGTILGGYHADTIEVLDLITEIYPGELWKRVTKYLGPPIDLRAHHIRDWLRGNRFFEDKGGSLTSFTPEMVWGWVNEDIDNRAWYLASFVPKVLFRREGEICWARELLVRYGERKDVRNNLEANFSTEGWTGPSSLHFQQKKDELLSFKQGEENKNVRRWIDDFVSNLDKRIEYEKMLEEREF